MVVVVCIWLTETLMLTIMTLTIIISTLVISIVVFKMRIKFYLSQMDAPLIMQMNLLGTEVVMPSELSSYSTLALVPSVSLEMNGIHPTDMRPTGDFSSLEISLLFYTNA